MLLLDFAVARETRKSGKKNKKNTATGSITIYLSVNNKD